MDYDNLEHLLETLIGKCLLDYFKTSLRIKLKKEEGKSRKKEIEEILLLFPEISSIQQEAGNLPAEAFMSIVENQIDFYSNRIVDEHKKLLEWHKKCFLYWTRERLKLKRWEKFHKQYKKLGLKQSQWKEIYKAVRLEVSNRGTSPEKALTELPSKYLPLKDQLMEIFGKIPVFSDLRVREERQIEEVLTQFEKSGGEWKEMKLFVFEQSDEEVLFKCATDKLSEIISDELQNLYAYCHLFQLNWKKLIKKCESQRNNLGDKIISEVKQKRDNFCIDPYSLFRILANDAWINNILNDTLNYIEDHYIVGKKQVIRIRSRLVKMLKKIRELKKESFVLKKPLPTMSPEEFKEKIWEFNKVKPLLPGIKRDTIDKIAIALPIDNSDEMFSKFINALYLICR